MKKLLMILCGFALVVGLTFAGGNQEKGTGARESSSVDDLSRKITYTFNGTAYAEPGPDAWVFKYWGDKLNMELKYVFLEPSRAGELLNLLFASGDEPDAWNVKGGYDVFQKYIDEDLITPIPEDLLNTYGPNIVKALNGASNEGWDTARYQGQIYNLPSQIAHHLFPAPVIWRDDWLRKVGIDIIPATIAEAEKAFTAFRNDDPDGNGKKDTYGLSAKGIDVIYGAFGYLPHFWAVKDGKMVYGAVQPEMKEALALLAQWYKAELIDPEFVTGENKGGYWALTHDFINNRIGFTSMGMYYHWKPPLYEGDFYGQDTKEFTSLNPTGSYTFGQPVVGPKGKSGTRKGNIAIPSFVFAKRLADDSVKFARIIRLYNDIIESRDSFLLTYYGQKGVHWEETDGLPSGIGKYTDIQEMAKFGGHTTLTVTYPLDYLWFLYPKWGDWAVIQGLKYDHYYVNELKAPLPSQGKYLADLIKLQEEIYIAIITGQKPISAFDTFVSNWMKNGGEILTAEANQWYANK